MRLCDKITYMPDKHPNHNRLYDLASAQAGYFTGRDATRSGFNSWLVDYHVRRGRFERVGRGLYRLRNFPVSPDGEIAAAWLAAGAKNAIISHDSALALHDLGNVSPSAVHITVPRSSRWRSARSIPGVHLHTTTHPLPPEDVIVQRGVRVTTAERAILDSAQRGLDPEELARVAKEAIERGWTSAARLKRRAVRYGARVERLISQSLDRRSS